MKLRLLRVLRSRRLAIILLVALTLYSWVATWLVPEQAPTFLTGTASGLVGRTAALLGFAHPFSAPLFLGVVALVALSTAACAWERSATTWRELRSVRLERYSAEGLADSPQHVVAVDTRAFDAAGAGAAATAVLSRLRLRIRTVGDVTVGTSRPYGLAGSALFHWALVGVCVLAGLGQLVRYEGYANITAGESVVDVGETYGSTLVQGALAGGAYTGLTLAVAEIDLGFEAGGVDRGAAPDVVLSDGSRQLERQWVYPNNPLRHGSLVVHNSGVKPVFLGTIRSDDSTATGQVALYFDFESKEPQQFVLTDESGAITTVTVTPIGGQRVEVLVGDRGAGAAQTVGVGDSVELTPHERLTVDGLTYAAQLHVVNDWTVPWLYLMFGLGILGVSAAVFIPSRSVWMTIVENERDAPGALALHVRYTCRRNDPAFPRQLREALTRAVGTESPTEQEESE